MAGLPVEGGSPVNAAPAPDPERVVSDEDKKLAAEWLKRIEAALKRVDKKFKTFEANRQLLAGKVKKDSDDTVRANLHYANMAAMLPQVYAKDPEFAAQPTPAVPPEQMEAVKGFADTAEFLLKKLVVKDARLKKQAKKILRSTFATSVGWLKASWQEERGQDPLIANRLKDTQDNIAHLERLLAESQDPARSGEHEAKLAELKQAMEGLKIPQEITVAQGIALDFVMSEDILIIDPSIRSVDDYPRAGAMAHRVWMTPEKYRETFGYTSKKGKSYTEQNGAIAATDAKDEKATLLCVWEVWSQADNRLFYVCDGEEGFCKPPNSPEWTGKRWYPFFLTAFNEIDGSFYPLSDIELTDKLVKEYNESREDFVRDRRECLPINVIRKGGSLTPDDVEKLKNRRGGDTIVVEGVGQNPLTADIFMGSMATLRGENYDTGATRSDIERILGGSDATTGSITKAKTATEAEILSQGLRSRSGERQDILEDMLNELGPYCLEIMLRKLPEQKVKEMVGPQAVWPTMDLDQIFNLVTVEVRGGSTGKPDRLQEQDRWTKLLPIINEAVGKVSELRSTGQDALAQAVIELTRETLRRFDERLDIEQFLPKAPEGEDDPVALKQQVFTMKQQGEKMVAQLKDATDKVEKGFISAAAQIATSQMPGPAALVFTELLGMPMPEGAAAMGLGVPGADPSADPMADPAQIPQPQEAMPPQTDAIPPQPPGPSLPQP
jgi:hypothetical protein